MAKPIEYTTIFRGKEAEEFIKSIENPPKNRDRERTLARAMEIKLDLTKL